MDEQVFDIILAADVVAAPYRKHFRDLLKTFNALCGEDCEILLAYKPRCASEFDFFRLARQYYIIEREAFQSAGDVSLFKLRRKGKADRGRTSNLPTTGSFLGDF